VGSFNIPEIEFVAATPLPAALPFFAGGLGVVGWLSRRRKRTDAAVWAFLVESIGVQSLDADLHSRREDGITESPGTGTSSNMPRCRCSGRQRHRQDRLRYH
jgi:hypothetical protein